MSLCFLNEVNPARHSQLEAAACTAQLTPDGRNLSLVVAKLPHAADEYDESLRLTPELESSMVATAVWQVHCNSSYHTCSSSDKQSKDRTKQANHNDDDSQSTDEAGAATTAAAVVVAARAPSPQANQRGTAKETQAETAIGS